MMLVAACLDGYTSVVLALGKAPEAARLIGAAERLREELVTVRDNFEQRLFDETVTSLRVTLGDEAFAAEVARGRKWSLEEAMDAALAATQEG